MTELLISRRSMFGIVGAGALASTMAVPGEVQAATASAGEIDAAVNAAYTQYRTLTEGANADYIPALAKVPSNYFGVSVVTGDGKAYDVGDSDKQFSMQSISKVYTMAIVMQESGALKIIDSVGVDATGRVFNSIDAIEQYRGKEMNPLVNPGAIATTGNIKGASPDAVWTKIINTYSDFAGRKLEVNQEVYKSEAETNQRNRAIGSLMWAYERFPMDPLVATDLYTRQCSVNVTSHDLAVMAATLAFGGRNPVTKKQVIDPGHVPGILSVMATAGLYDDSGKWLFQAGVPAKSGVGGGLIAVVPGRFGIGTFAPPLDQAGNSVRGQKAIIDIINRLKANPYAQFS